MREVLATAMLEALGVETSKTFSLIETGEALERGDEPSPTRSAVLVRLSHSHLRIGTFQRFLFLEQPEAIARLVDYVVETYYPGIRAADGAERAALFFEAMTARVARMGAQWMAAGFVHGVLNTDNINVTGESFDYGPWRFAPVHDRSSGCTSARPRPRCSGPISCATWSSAGCQVCNLSSRTRTRGLKPPYAAS